MDNLTADKSLETVHHESKPTNHMVTQKHHLYPSLPAGIFKSNGMRPEFSSLERFLVEHEI